MKTSARFLLYAAWAALAIVGLFGLYERLVAGRELTHYGSYVPWGLWVSCYIYFIGLSAGSFLFSSLIYVFGIDKLRRVGRLALFVAAVALFMALISIWMDLGQMWRFYEIFTRPNFSSMMTWMVWLYTAYFFLILIEAWLEMREDLALKVREGGSLTLLYKLLSLGWNCPEDEAGRAVARKSAHRTLRVLGSFGVPLAIAFHGGVGALFATVSSRPYWHSSLFPILFLTGALASGGALLLALSAMMLEGDTEEERSILRLLGRMVLGLLAFDLVLEWAETSVPLWYGVGPEVHLFQEVLFGRFWYVFWIFHLLLGAVIPIALLVKSSGSRSVSVIAGGLIATTFLAVRLNLVIPGLVTPQMRGLGEAYVDDRLQFSYVPSSFEWAVVALIVAGGMALFFVGKRILPLDTRTQEA
jgi:Ni/Fe-hydrogenase subunit HybB-like protein